MEAQARELIELEADDERKYAISVAKKSSTATINRLQRIVMGNDDKVAVTAAGLLLKAAKIIDAPTVNQGTQIQISGGNFQMIAQVLGELKAHGAT